jgi:hypothetical protein
MGTVKSVIFLFSLLLILGCNQDSQSKSVTVKNIDIGILTMKLPSTFRYIPGNGIDSYVAQFIDEKMDTFNVEYGSPRIIYDLFGNPPDVFPLKDREWIKKQYRGALTPDDALFSKYPVKDNKQAIFLKNYFMYDTINNIVVKIVQPKRIGNGITGIFIPELPDSNGLSIYANNLDSADHIEALQIFHTIRYRQAELVVSEKWTLLKTSK